MLHQPCRIDSSHMISSWTIPFLILDPILGVVLFLDGCRTVAHVGLLELDLVLGVPLGDLRANFPQLLGFLLLRLLLDWAVHDEETGRLAELHDVSRPHLLEGHAGELPLVDLGAVRRAKIAHPHPPV